MNRMDFIEARARIRVDYAPGEVEIVTQHDGSILRLRKVAPDYDPTDRISAIGHLAAAPDARRGGDRAAVRGPRGARPSRSPATRFKSR